MGNLEGWRFRFAQNLEFFHDDFHLAGGHLWIVGSLEALRHFSGDGDDPLRTDRLGNRKKFLRSLRMTDNLREAVAVSDIEEDESTVVATRVDPAAERHRCTSVFGRQFAAGVST